MNSPQVPPDAEARQLLLRSVYREFPPITMALQAGGHESSVLFADAVRAYLDGIFAAALVCGHASCERELAGWVDWLGAAAPKGWDYWGLGKLTAFAVSHGGMPQDVAEVLFDVNEKRRLLSHFKKNAPRPSQWARALDQLHVFDSDDFRSAYNSVLAEDALLAIKACLLVRSTELERVPVREA